VDRFYDTLLGIVKPFPIGYLRWDMRQTKPRRAAPKPLLTIDPDATWDMTSRLARIEGQVRAIGRMIEERRSCDLIVQQLSAARTALERATAVLMVTSLAQCIRSSGPNADAAELERLSDSFVGLL
jgi:DNA-binding FrmR family transcriptional regulator